MSIFSSLFGGGENTGTPRANAVIDDKVLLVRGWNEEELKQIINDFIRLYREPLPGFSTEIHAGDPGVLRVTFPGDIHPEFFFFFVNYVQYPKDFDLQSRSILVAGSGMMNSNFLPSEQNLTGKRITIYIPADDNEYDVVFARVDDRSYEYPFSRGRWRSAPEPRLPAGISDLK